MAMIDMHTIHHKPDKNKNHTHTRAHAYVHAHTHTHTLHTYGRCVGCREVWLQPFAAEIGTINLLVTL